VRVIILLIRLTRLDSRGPDSMAETQDDRKKRDEQIRETIMAKLVETGEKDR
jgi:hypothetical protein